MARARSSPSLGTLAPVSRSERGEKSSLLCRKLPNGEEQCATIALEARDLFQTMQVRRAR